MKAINDPTSVSLLKRQSLFQAKKHSFSTSAAPNHLRANTMSINNSYTNSNYCNNNRHYHSPKSKAKSFCQREKLETRPDTHGDDTCNVDESSNLLDPDLIPSSVQESLMSIHYHLHKKPHLLQTSFISKSENFFENRRRDERTKNSK